MSIVSPYDYDAESISKVCVMTARITIEKEGIFWVYLKKGYH